MSSTVAVQTIGLNQASNALEFNQHPLMQQLSNTTKSLNALQWQPSPSLANIPNLLNLFTASAKLQPGTAVLASSNVQSISNNSLESKAILPTSGQKSLLADAQPPVQAVPLIYQVKQGDTLFQIAKEHQVTKDELVKLNQIENSNVIFVDQKLQIPLMAKDQSLDSTSTAIASQPIKKVAPVSSTSEEDPYIANLRSEIDQLRAQYQQERQAAKNNTDGKSVSLSPKSTPLERSNSSAKSNSSKSSLQPNQSKPSQLALRLPPLSDSEQYLPDAFDGYVWPAEGVMTSGYGMRWGRMHQGVDIAAPIGTPVVAAAAGEVVGAGWHSGYGNLVKLQHPDGSVTYYGHCDRILVTHGQQVEQGEEIAKMGNTGFSTGSHVHFEIRLADQKIVDPLTLLSER